MALVLPTFTYGIEFWRGDLKIPRRKVFERGTKIHKMSHVKVCSLTTNHILLVEFRELPVELHSQAQYNFLTTSHPPIPLLVSE